MLIEYQHRPQENNNMHDMRSLKIKNAFKTKNKLCIVM